MNNLYREEILEHYKDPQNFGKLPEFTHYSKLTNPFCGDDIEIFLNISSCCKAAPGQKILCHNSQITEVGFTGNGCAISIAGTSILTEFIKGKSIKELTSMTESDMLDLLKIDVSETRKKCAILGYSTLRDCILRTK